MSALKMPWHGHSATFATRVEFSRFARELLSDPAYQAELKKRLLQGVLPPALEVALYHYAFGKPQESIALSVTEHSDLAAMSTEELLKRASAVSDALREAQKLEEEVSSAVLQGPWAHTASAGASGGATGGSSASPVSAAP